MALFWGSPTSTFWQTPTSSLFWNSANWTETSTGTGTTGSFGASGGTYTVSGSTPGAGIGGTSDTIYFASQPASGNIEFIALVSSQSGTDPYAVAGLMVSDLSSADPTSPQCALISVSPENGINFFFRTSDGAAASFTLGPSIPAPVWLRLTVSGNLVSGYQSADGIQWQLVGQVAMAFTGSFAVGFAVSSNSTSLTNTAVFNNLSYLTNVPQPITGFISNWQETGIGSTTGSFSQTGAGSFTVSGNGTGYGAPGGVSGTSDSLFFAYQPVSGNITLTTMVSSQSSTANGTETGLMVSDLLPADPTSTLSAFNAVCVYAPQGINFFYRQQDGVASVAPEAVSSSPTGPPVWLQIVVTQGQVNGFYSTDGVNWIPSGSGLMTLPANYYAGFATCSGSMTQNTVQFTQTSMVQNASMLTFLRGDAGVAYNGSDQVLGWTDQSNSGYSAFQNTATLAPTITPGVSLPSLSFNGSSEFLQLPGNAPGTQPATYNNFTAGASFFLVLNPAALAAGSVILDIGNGAAADNLRISESNTTGGLQFSVYAGSLASSVSSSSGLTTGQLQLVEAFYDGVGFATLSVNGVQLAQSSAMNTANNTSRGDNFIGQTGAAGGGNYFNGKIAEILLYSRMLTRLEIENVESYLLNKYGI